MRSALIGYWIAVSMLVRKYRCRVRQLISFYIYCFYLALIELKIFCIDVVFVFNCLSSILILPLVFVFKTRANSKWRRWEVDLSSFKLLENLLDLLVVWYTVNINTFNKQVNKNLCVLDVMLRLYFYWFLYQLTSAIFEK